MQFRAKPFHRAQIAGARAGGDLGERFRGAGGGNGLVRAIFQAAFSAASLAPTTSRSSALARSRLSHVLSSFL
jgi:hypothetical protein